MSHRPMPSLDKASLVAEVLRALEREHEVLKVAQRATQDGATHEENRSESDKDMRAVEASYLARGQAERVVAIEAEMARLRALEIRPFGGEDSIEASALVTIRSGSRRSRVLLLPGGAGMELGAGDARVRVVTPASPLGSALLGASLGDVVEVERGGDTLEWEILALE